MIQKTGSNRLALALVLLPITLLLIGLLTGTVAWFFLLINASKVPLFAGLGMINAGTLKFDLLVAPAALAGAFAGRRLLHALSDRAFHTLVLLLAVAAGLRLLF